MKDNPKISVCMATYNGGTFIKEQLVSILLQLRQNDEIIISDDSSSDNTLAIIESFNDERIKLIKYQKFRSAVLNFENALKLATGDYIFLSDQDDIWAPNKVKVMADALKNADLVVSDCDFIDAKGEVISASNYKLYDSGPGILKNFIKNTYLGNCMAFNHKVLRKVLPFPKQLVKASSMLLFHDVWIGLVANIFFRVKFIPDKLSSYRRHSNNASPTEISAISPNRLSTKLRSRFLLSMALICRLIGYS